MPERGIVQNISRCKIWNFLFHEAKPSEIVHSKFDRVIYFYYSTNIGIQYLFLYNDTNRIIFQPLNSTYYSMAQNQCHHYIIRNILFSDQPVIEIAFFFF